MTSCYTRNIYTPKETRSETPVNMIPKVPHNPNMQQFMHQVRANLAQNEAGAEGARSDWSEPFTYNCLTPVSNTFAQEIRQSLHKLTGQPGFPLPYPVVLKQNDLAKLSKFDYQAVICRGELRMALCFLQVGDRKTVTVLVSENMMVVRVRMQKVPFGIFRGSVFSGYATPSSDGSAGFVISDCLYYRGRNLARRPLQERLESCLLCVEDASKDVTESGFRLSITPTWNVQDEALWTALEEDDSWSSVLFVPASLAIKTGAVQSTLFEHSAVDFKDVADALTESIARPDLLDDCRGATVTSWAADIPEEEGQATAPQTAEPVPEIQQVVVVTKTYSQALQTVTDTKADGVDTAEKQAGEEESGPAAAGEVAATS